MTERDKHLDHIATVLRDMPYEKLCVIDFLCDMILTPRHYPNDGLTAEHEAFRELNRLE